jgi:hypothetical protein
MAGLCLGHAVAATALMALNAGPVPQKTWMDDPDCLGLKWGEQPVAPPAGLEDALEF